MKKQQNETMNKKDLLLKAGKEWGLESPDTDTLYEMCADGRSYELMRRFYDYVNDRLARQMQEDLGN